ncbi:MAG: adenylosuccinate lyase [Phycisphaerales bacterium]|nr:adenylosuccinate lyase [Phycisphaerales bacterium]MCB9837317.1 adenylosuccinate lyase [Phycisphaera sp.]
MPENAPIGPHDTYTSPLAARNASPEMCRIWSPRHKFQTWRKIWLAVAEAQYEVTKDWPQTQGRAPLVSPEQIEELRANLEVTDEDLALAAKYEAELRHDVMAHVHAWGDRCPKARPIIHLGMTSQDVVCNADLAVLYEAKELIQSKLELAVCGLGESAESQASIPTLAFTHYQAAQPTTVGRRISGWAYDLVLCEDRLSTGYPLADNRGLRGATGTQASFMNLFGGDVDQVDRFEMKFLAARGELVPGADATSEPSQLCNEFDKVLSDAPLKKIAQQAAFQLTGQTYPRVYDTFILADLASIASVLHKIATDIRLLSNRKEIDEPFGKNQIGSSAMPYKRNPMKCERICGLTRFVMNLVGNAYDTAATQWLERTLDDSSNRRLSLPEAFLALDGALDLMHQVASGLVVNEAMVRKNLMAELPFLATENIMMEAVKAGGDRQNLHEKIRVHAQAAGHRVKQEGLDNDLIERLRNDDAFKSVHHLLTEDQLLDPMKYVGRSVEQTERFLREVVEPLRERYAGELDKLGSSDRGV